MILLVVACSGTDTGCEPGAWYVDADHDGAGDAQTEAQWACAAPRGFVPTGDDCDDTRPDVRPGGDDTTCDGVDQDCSGEADDRGPVGFAWTDEDGDGVAGTTSSLGPCVASTETPSEPDCDDAAPEIRPGVVDLCGDGIDQDCSGAADEACGLLDSSFVGSVEGAWVGESVALPGDLTGDGLDDVVATAHDPLGALLIAGPFRGEIAEPDAWLYASSFTATPLSVGDPPGDLDGDGRPDLFLATELGPAVAFSAFRTGDSLRPEDWWVSLDGCSDGAVDIYAARAVVACQGDTTARVFDSFGAGEHDASSAASTLQAAADRAPYNLGVEWLGDLDGDGMVELAVTAQEDVDPQPCGYEYCWDTWSEIYLFRGPLPVSASWADADVMLDGAAGLDFPEWQAEKVGDLDGDGNADLMLAGGAPRPDASYTIRRFVGVPTAVDDAAAVGILDGADWLQDAEGGTDVDADGQGDLLVLTWTSLFGIGPFVGVVGEEDALAGVAFGIEEHLQLAQGRGDVDGDGRDDVVLSAYDWTEGDLDGAGCIWLINGTLLAPP